MCAPLTMRKCAWGSYELFRQAELLTETVWERLMMGLTTRKYGQTVRQLTEAYGLEKSAVSEHFIEASRAKLKDLMERRLDKLNLCALLIDATPFEGQQMVAALGIGQDGRKTILGLRQGATENATVVGELLGDLVNRGLDLTKPRLYVLDGGKALATAVRKHAGNGALISDVRFTSEGMCSIIWPRSRSRRWRRTECSLRERGIRGGQAGAELAAPGIDGTQSKCGAQSGRGVGGDADGASTASAASVAQDTGEHECDRVGLLGGGECVCECEALARR